MKTVEILKKYGISRQSLYNWTTYNKLRLNRSVNGHYIWDTQSIMRLENFIKERKKENIGHHPEKTANDRFNLHNRRYLGSKTRMLSFIDKVVTNHTNNVQTVADIFGGTGSVADMFFNKGCNIILNDLLLSNFVTYEAFFNKEPVNDQRIIQYVDQMNSLHPKKNYVSENYGDKYFSMENAMKIGEAREFIERLDQAGKLNKHEKSILLTSILFAMDRVANTVGHYDAYRKKLDMIDPIFFKVPAYYTNFKNHVDLRDEDANKLIRNITADLVYIDPPYNSRQYGDIYHVLENITTWKKPKLYGVARKPAVQNRKNTKSLYSTSKAPQTFDDLISHVSARYVLVSYNNMAKKGNGRSNAKISKNEIISSLQKRGNVKVFNISYQPFSSGKSNIKDHKELLYLLEIEDE